MLVQGRSSTFKTITNGSLFPLALFFETLVPRRIFRRKQQEQPKSNKNEAMIVPTAIPITSFWLYFIRRSPLSLPALLERSSKNVVALFVPFPNCEGISHSLEVSFPNGSETKKVPSSVLFVASFIGKGGALISTKTRARAPYLLQSVLSWRFGERMLTTKNGGILICYNKRSGKNESRPTQNKNLVRTPAGKRLGEAKEAVRKKQQVGRNGTLDNVLLTYAIVEFVVFHFRHEHHDN